jgi:hypothetical protein
MSAQPSPSGPGGGSAQTNASGDYTISGLAAGSYKVQFSACPGGGNYVTEWWDNKPDVNTADTISLAAGASRTGVDAQLARPTISGHVTNATGDPLQNICVSAQPSPSGPGGGSAQTNASGDYTISGLAAGSYKVQFSACPGGGNYVTEWWDDRPDAGAADTISLAAGASRTGVDAQLARPTTTGPVTPGQAESGTSGQAAPSPTPAPAPTPTVKPPSNVFAIGSRITFENGITVLTVNVPGPGVLTAAQSAPAGVRSTTARAANGKRFTPLIKTVRVKVNKRGKVALQLKATAAGRKVLRKRGKFTAKVRITFTPTGGKPKSVVQTVTVKRFTTHKRH